VMKGGQVVVNKTDGRTTPSAARRH
jgi:hypothetical protein